MSTKRQRRAGANPPPYAVDEDGDRIYTEEDYAIHVEPVERDPADIAFAESIGWTTDASMPDEAFEPDEEDAALEEAEWAAEPTPENYAPFHLEGYDPLFNGEADFSEDDLDPLDEELLTQEEQEELRRSHWQLLSALADFAGVIVGTAVILVLITLLVSLLNWLVSDMSQSFILLQKHL